MIITSLGRDTSLPLGSPEVGWPTFSLWTVEFCSADDGTAVARSLEPRQLGQVGLGFGQENAQTIIS